jgi:two-component system CheB/CheR fusion protein
MPAGVQGDPLRLTQALTNVLRNALEFTPRGGSVSVRLTAVGPAAVGPATVWDRIALSVLDTGMGIEREMLPTLFEPFSQAAQSLDRSRGGLGLGLPTVKGILELHGGSVSLTSEGSGQGTEVTLLLPRAEAPAATGAGAVPRSLRARRVLVIEDNLDALESMRDVLRLGGHAVEVALDGMRGLDLAQTFRPEIVFCDIGLPGMNGYAVARAFRAAPALRNVYLVALSGYSQQRAVQQALAAGFDRHVAKPVTLAFLEQLLSEAPPLE